MKGKVYSTCILCIMKNGSVTWLMRVYDMRHVERAEKRMIRWMYGDTLRNGKTSKEIRNRLGIVSMSDVVHQSRLRWFGHVEH